MRGGVSVTVETVGVGPEQGRRLHRCRGFLCRVGGGTEATGETKRREFRGPGVLVGGGGFIVADAV